LESAYTPAFRTRFVVNRNVVVAINEKPAVNYGPLTSPIRPCVQIERQVFPHRPLSKTLNTENLLDRTLVLL
jgi:hypothetical protein